MDKRILILCVFLILSMGGVHSVFAEIASPYQKMSNQYSQINQQVTDIMGTTLQDIADGYTPYSRIGWKIAINGIDESSDTSKVECGWGYITGYDSSSGLLSGQGQMYEVSPGSTAANPVVDSLGTATMSIQVDENSLSISTGGSDPEGHTAWAQLLGTYSNLQDGGHRIFYGFGNNPDYSASMCILTLSNLQVASTPDQEDEEVGYTGWNYDFETITPTPTQPIRKTMNFPSSNLGSI